MMPEVARRASTPRRARARTWAAVPAAPPNGAAVATALPTSWVEAMSASGVRRPGAAVDQQALEHPGEVQHRGLGREQGQQPVPVDLDQLVGRGQDPEHRRRQEVHHAAAQDPRQPAPGHTAQRGPVHRPDGGGIAGGRSCLLGDERAQQVLVGGVSHRRFRHGVRVCELSAVGPPEHRDREPTGRGPLSPGRGPGRERLIPWISACRGAPLTRSARGHPGSELVEGAGGGTEDERCDSSGNGSTASSSSATTPGILASGCG